jgi:diguanylate cyclase (GGDEF)-like protein
LLQVLEFNNHPTGLTGGDETFDWYDSANTQDSTWRERLPFLAGATLILCILIWQLTVLIHQMLAEQRESIRIGYSIANIFICSLISAGLFLLHRSTAENRALRRHLRLAEGLQKNQSLLWSRNRELEMQSRTDFLTGVGNSLLLCETLEIETQRCDRYGDDLSLALIEFGGLRKLHAMMGRQAVDEAIRIRGNLIQKGIGASDWSFRRSDGEFVVVWLNSSPQSAIENSKRLYKTLQENPAVDGQDLPVSIGVTSYVVKEGPDRLLARADLAKKGLYKGGFRALAPDDSVLSVQAA